ncbi:hypothetical protein [Paenibacillus lutimineralis]|uniref:hypothetical protein n=1 Tax=Paenibacillus lutimineralis TaxID=2707005 RepID=UPI001D041A5F|nr:hypothetical protein [Paenibacillus lutimineralis]
MNLSTIKNKSNRVNSQLFSAKKGVDWSGIYVMTDYYGKRTDASVGKRDLALVLKLKIWDNSTDYILFGVTDERLFYSFEKRNWHE